MHKFAYSDEKKTKQIVFWLIAITIPFIFFLTIEFSLRLGGYQGEKQDLFIEAPNTPGYLIANPKFISRYFPSFIPEIAPNAFLKEKKNNSFRVFVFGGSSTEGFPYNFYTSFPDQLEQLLLLNTQGLNIEVINLGMTAVNSYVIRDLSKRVLEYEPDAIIIYAGHNEYYGSFGSASTQFGFSNSVNLKHIILKLKDFRIYQLLEESLFKSSTDSGEQRTMMAKVIRESDIERESETFAQGLIQYETNIGDVIETFEKRNIPVYIGTVTSNLKDQPPLTDDPKVLSIYQEAQALFLKDSLHAAIKIFEQAKELDGTRFRAPSEINTLIKSFEQSPIVTVFDVQKAFRENSESGIEDASLFIDHLHPNDRGHKLIASLLFDTIVEHPKLKGSIQLNFVQPPQDISAFEKAFAEVSIARLLVGYPFTKGQSIQQELDAFETIYTSYIESSYVDSIAAVTSKNQIFVPLALTDLVAKARQRNDTMAVVTHSYDLLKWQLKSMNLIESSIDYMFKSDEEEGYLINVLHQVLNDGNDDPRYLDLLSSLYLLNENTEQADFWLKETERYQKDSPRLLYNYSRFYLLKGDTLKASEYYRRFLSSQSQR